MAQQIKSVTPRCLVRLFRTIDRTATSGSAPSSQRYQGSDPYIDLTPMLGDGSSVRTSKSTREPCGGFVITFTDKAYRDKNAYIQDLESVYGLAEPMDIVEIRMWNGVGVWSPSEPYPIVMRGFVSDVVRSQTMGADGKPMRTVTISGHDFGKIWQTFQVLHLPNYAEGKGLLTNFALSELFGVSARNSMKAAEFIKQMVEKIINPHLDKLLPAVMPNNMPRVIQTGGSLLVKHGTIGVSFHQMQGSLYDIMRFHGDVGHWNELYTEDREDGVYCVYRPIPAVNLADKKKIMDDAPDPVYCVIEDSFIESISVARGDSGVANFYWVDAAKYDMISDMSRRLHGLSENSVSLKDYPNSAVKYYGIRALYASTQMSGDEVLSQTSGQSKESQDKRDTQQLGWVNTRRKQLMELNKDNVVLERGSARIKGGPMRDDDVTLMKPGDYAMFAVGSLAWAAYVYQIDHEFIPYQGYTTTLNFDRGEGFAERTRVDGASSPWLVEQRSAY